MTATREPPQASANAAGATAGTRTSSEPTDTRAGPPPLVVGIGASAGGLEAYQAFFDAMPASSEVAFVLVSHLSPDHRSMLAELVARHTAMRVQVAADGMAVEGGGIYVIPPDATLTIADGVLQLNQPAPPRQYRWPIDTFLVSLAADQGENAVAIVLSGSGSDGSRGVREIKAQGGLTLAQADDGAAMGGMPANAAATGLVDHVLPVEAMPTCLLEHHAHLRAAAQAKGPDGLRQDIASQLPAVCELLLSGVGHDFSQYKSKTLVRRIQRRMQVTQLDTVAGYLDYLRANPDELQRLMRELLIGVTEFFRDPEAFQALQEQAVPLLLEGRRAADVVRIWVPACATGEEAYSIAIVFAEEIAKRGGGPSVQLYATDLDEHAIQSARSGRFRGPLPGVSPERLERWFVRDGEHYTIVKRIREMIVFSPHSVVKDPPFSRLDLVSCRNLLIYFDAQLQERLVRTFHYALNPGGILLLGPSESLGRSAALFAPLDKQHRLFQRRGDGRAPPPLDPQRRDMSATAIRSGVAAMQRSEDVIERAARDVMARHAPAYVIIDRDHEVLRFAGNTGRYLGPAPGTASLNLFALLQKGLRAPARAAIQQATTQQRAAVQLGQVAGPGGEVATVRLVAEPIPDGHEATRGGRAAGGLCVLVFKEPVATVAPAGPARAVAAGGDAGRIAELEQALDTTWQQLQTTIEELETAKEEMTSAHEEFQSVNEELQSSNEELETSKEEMQSINEELQIINVEINRKNEELARLNSDLKNLLESTQIATLFLDPSLRVRGFTPAISDVFHLRDADLDRPITEITARVPYPQLEDDVKRVLASLSMVERMLEGGPGDSVYLLRMRPYRTTDNVIDGVVLAFIDITERRRTAWMLRESERRLTSIVKQTTVGVAETELSGTLVMVNPRFAEILGTTADDLLGRRLDDFAHPDHAAQARRRFEEALAGGRAYQADVLYVRRDGREVWASNNTSLILDENGKPVSAVTVLLDITPSRLAQQHRELLLAELDHRVKNTLATVLAIALQTFRSSSGMEEFRDAFQSRLLSLSRTHELLARDGWRGIGIRQILETELAPYVRAGAQGSVDGPDVHLSPKIALSLSMALHELTTNAVKYGALSVPEGAVDVDWRLEDEQLHLQWREHGGPEVNTPERRGFGSRVLLQGIGHELNGRVQLEFRAAGVWCSIVVPLHPA